MLVSPGLGYTVSPDTWPQIIAGFDRSATAACCCRIPGSGGRVQSMSATLARPHESLSQDTASSLDTVARAVLCCRSAQHRRPHF